MKKLLFLFAFISTSAFAIDRPIPCTGNSCKLLFETTGAGGAKVSAGNFDGTGTLNLFAPLPVASGGTAGTTQVAARTGLGLGTLSTLSAVGSAQITDDSIVNVDINSAAAITATKVQAASSSTGGVLTNTAQEIQGIKSFQDNPLVTAYDTSGTAVTSTTTIPFNTETTDRSGSFTGGVFTAPVDGVYFMAVYARVSCNSGPNTSYLSLLYNNTSSSFLSYEFSSYSAITNNAVQGSGFFRLFAGNTLRANMFNPTAGCSLLTNSFSVAKMSIVRVGPL